MLKTLTKTIGDRTYTVTQLPADQACDLLPMCIRGFAALTPGEARIYREALLHNLTVATADDPTKVRPCFPRERFNAEMDGHYTDVAALVVIAERLSIPFDVDALAAAVRDAPSSASST